MKTDKNQDPTQVITKFKVYCGEKYIADDIGNYLEGGKEQCLCKNTYYPPTEYKQM